MAMGWVAALARLDEARTTADTIANHVSDHNQLHTKANYVFDVMDYGAVGDGSTDDTVAIQAAITAAEAASGTVFFPPASVRYKVTSLTLSTSSGLVLEGVGEASELRSVGGSIFNLTGTVSKLAMRDLVLYGATAGKACLEISGSGVLSSGLFTGVRFYSATATSRNIMANGATWGMQDTTFIGCIYSGDGSSLSVPLIELIDTAGAGACNNNVWLGGRTIGSSGETGPQILLESQGANYMYNNTFQGITVEIPIDGFLTAHGTKGLALRDIGMYDSGTITADLIVIDKHASGLASAHTVIDNVWRIGGTIGSNFDVMLSATAGTVVTNSGASPSDAGRITIDAATTIIGGGWATITNEDTESLIAVGVTAGVVQLKKVGGMVRYGAGGPEIRSGTATPESAVTAPVGSLFLRSDGGTSTALYVKETGSGNTGWVAK